MSRRRARIRGDLGELAEAMAGLGHFDSPELEAARGRVIERLRDYLLPRFANELPPFVVALVGSTGSGKSTLLNSLSGSAVSTTGVLRPTTRLVTVWTSEEHREKLSGLGEVRTDEHPLLASLALIDTPDLDSDEIGNRRMALKMAGSVDGILFVTTANRYGDALPWATLTEVAATMPVGVILNRVPARASGARNDLIARLRRRGLGGLPVFSITEQRIDPGKARLAPQSVQRVSSQLRDWARAGEDHRVKTMDLVIDAVVEDVERVLGAARDRREIKVDVRQRIHARYQKLLDELETVVPTRPTRKREWLRRRPPIDTGALSTRVVDMLDQAASETAGMAAACSMSVPVEFMRASDAAVSAVKVGVRGDGPSDGISSAIAGERERIISRVRADDEALIDAIARGLERLIYG